VIVNTQDLQGGRIQEGDASRDIGNIQSICRGRDGSEDCFRSGWQPRSSDHVLIVIRRWPGAPPG
jgi:hypothetical protein